MEPVRNCFKPRVLHMGKACVSEIERDSVPS